MKFPIKNRFSNALIFEAELDASFDNQSYSFKLGAAVKLAVKSEADLSEADLSEANLSKANLSKADLSWANLSKADLSEANLSKANLSKANLSWANLSKADLSEANLSKANLSKADLSEADLSEANLSKANLSKANLSEANLSEANLQNYKQDLIAEILKLPNELEALRDALAAGKIDGSTYSDNGCACLAGTLAKAYRKIPTEKDIGVSDCTVKVNGFSFHADSSSPRERWFMQISPGDTPETNVAAKIALAWINEAIEMRDYIRKAA